MNVGVVVFPGSNCDDDMVHVMSSVMGAKVHKIWHKEQRLTDYGRLDVIFLPGGFSYGDYVRSGAIARFSPIMQEVIKFANEGGMVWGICNGFQILCEAGLLPGALSRNINQKFICKNIYLKTKTTNSAITSLLEDDQILKIPIAHAEGRYHADDKTLSELKANDRILFTYCDALGNESNTANVNGSIDNIAGICNKERNVFGMMPHPERASESALGNVDGKAMFEGLFEYVNKTLAKV